MKDIIGTEVKVGDYVILSPSSASTLSYGRVMKVTDRTVQVFHSRNLPASPFLAWDNKSVIRGENRCLITTDETHIKRIKKVFPHVDEEYFNKTFLSKGVDLV